MIELSVFEKKQLVSILLIVYILLILTFTVFSRPVSFSEVETTLLWSYKEWFNGNKTTGHQILGNIAMFVPFGYLLTEVLRSKRLLTVILCSIFFSLTIESLQLFFHRGLPEVDDLLNNTLGGVIGWGAYKFMPNFSYMIGIVAIGAAIFVISSQSKNASNIPQVFCFQVYESEKNELSGFAFLYEIDAEEVSIRLKPRWGKTLSCQTTYCLPTPDVNEYFLCDRDYSKTGFRAVFPENTNLDEEYEIVVSFSPMLEFNTGVYITGDRVHYTPDEKFTAPDIKADFIDKGILRVYRPDYHCWVYQLENSLYWIVDKDFNFEEDGSTYIQYQLWTTQTENLPQHRLENNWFWDNIGGNFETYEIKGDFGPYRVMKRELPTEYSITSIVTGYHKDGKWIWQEYFRPIYNIFEGVDNSLISQEK